MVLFKPKKIIFDQIPCMANMDRTHPLDSKSMHERTPPIENTAVLGRAPPVGDAMEIVSEIDEKVLNFVDIENQNFLEKVEISMLDVSVCSLSDCALDIGVDEFVLDSESKIDKTFPIFGRTPPLCCRCWC